ncbi:hypothetical protein GQ42DRAFT_165755 [Ramicandelaber brevisporus]|nr:hypothetical protein GQ42DRAFT_165755 [Ramicandelaber brevisporus]
MKFTTLAVATVLAAAAVVAAMPPCSYYCNRAFQNCIKTRPRDECTDERNDCLNNCECVPGQICPKV